MPCSIDLPELFCEKGITKRDETEQSDRHRHQTRRIREESRLCLLLVLFAAKQRICTSRTGFVVEPEIKPYSMIITPKSLGLSPRGKTVASLG